MLTTYRLDDAHTVPTPAATSVRLSVRDSRSTPDEIKHMWRIPYQNAFGVLWHCAVMHHDPAGYLPRGAKSIPVRSQPRCHTQGSCPTNPMLYYGRA